MTQLDSHQTAAAHARCSTLSIRAGAGSGKTRTLLARAAYLAQLPSVDRVRIAAFTRAAAAEIAARVQDLPLDDRDAEKIETGTLHSFAADLLFRDPEAFGLRRAPVVVDEVEDRALRREAAKAGRPEAEYRRSCGVVSYDELISAGLDALRGYPAPYRLALLVDEAQDLTRREWALAQAMRPGSLTTVGDVAQSIYQWRGALGTILPEGHALPVGSQEERTLPVCYRSLPVVIGGANALEIPGKIVLSSARSPWGGLRLRADTETDEELLAQLVHGLTHIDDLSRPLCCWTEGGWRPGSPSKAILCRTRRRLELIAEAFSACGIPYCSPVLEARVWETPAARELIDLLQVVANPHADVYLRRCLLRAGLSEKDLARADVERTGVPARSLWNWTCDNVSHHSDAAQLLRALAFSGASVGETAAEVAARLCAGGIGTNAVAELVPPDLSVFEFLAWLATPGARQTHARERAGDAIELTTIHGAKGLEWDRVLVLGCEEDHFPAKRAQPDAAEERRLFYVATTRARDAVVYHASRRIPVPWGRGTAEARPSRFLAEVGL